MYGGVVCTVYVGVFVVMWCVKSAKNNQGLVNSKITQTETESFTKIKKETKFCLAEVGVSQSLLQGLVD